MNSDSAVPGLNRGAAHARPIVVPPLTEQRAIASVLGSFDDKIELNCRITETLEAMARAIFKSWFVNFDPVRAKAKGRKPDLPKHIANLFPDRFEDSEMGEIPARWRLGVFGDVSDVVRTTINPSETPDLEFEHFSLPAFDNGRQPKRELGKAIKSAKSRVPEDVVLLSKLNPEIERVWMVDVERKEYAICSTEFMVLRAQEPFNRSYLYWLCRSSSFRNELMGLVTGTSKSHQRVQPGVVAKLQTLVPPPAILEAFQDVVGPLMQRIQISGRQNITLAGIRDTLLPRLISGELRLPDEKRLVNEPVP
jgi:type I restriction enzyme S subunit